MILRFDRFAIDTDKFELTCAGKVRKVEPMVFDLIAHFAAHPDRVFSRDELIEAVWQGRAVSDATVATCVKGARRALDDDGEAQRLIQTVRGRGFRFAAAVSEARVETPNGHATAVDTLSGAAAADPTLVILPFRCLSEKPSAVHVADGLALDLGTILTRVPLLRLNTQGERYKGLDPQPTAQQVRADLGVDLVVDGSVRERAVHEQPAYEQDGELSAHVQLTDAQTGLRLWGEAFALDGGAAPIVGKLEPQLHRAMYESARSGEGAPTARSLFLEASGLLVTEGWHHESFPEATRLLAKSATLDPELALAPALLALLTGFGARIGLGTDHELASADAVRWAERALAVGSMDSTVLGYAGCCLADVGHLDRGEALLEQAIDLNPANGQALVALGAVRMTRGNPEDAVEHLSKGIEISPLDSRLSVWGALLAVALLLSKDIEGATEASRVACRRNDRTYLPRVALAGARLAGGDVPAALQALADARRIKPDLTAHQIAALIGEKLTLRLLDEEVSIS